MAIELCIQKPGAVVKYACPTQKMVVGIIKKRVKEIIADCPEELKPEWKTQDKVWLFPNGSEIQVAGTDGGSYDNLRGGSADLCIADEAAFMDELETVIFSVLAPTTDTTDGKIFLATTPNDKDANHDFHEHFLYPLDAAGKLLKFTYLDSPMVDDKQKAKILARYPGGEKNVKFRCEYLCEVPNVTEASVIPEFVDVEDRIVKEVDMPSHCDFYTSMDLGFVDLTVALFGYYDFKESRLVILDEYILNGPDTKTDVIARNVKRIEELRYVTTMGQQDTHLRVMDNNNLMLINEISTTYGLRFNPTQKHKKEQAVDNVRRWMEQEKIIIHPRCKNLLYHVKHGQWHYTRAGTSTGGFKHIKGNDAAGLLKSHADALDALIYMVRNIQAYRNPFPSNYASTWNEQDSHKGRKWKAENPSKAADFMRKVLNIKNK
jgi:hypothetical protein